MSAGTWKERSSQESSKAGKGEKYSSIQKEWPSARSEDLLQAERWKGDLTVYSLTVLL